MPGTALEQLTNEQLAMMAKGGNQNACEQLWKNIYKLIQKLVNTHIQEHGLVSGVDREDLLQGGYIAMVEAVKAFDETAGWKFTTYLHRPMQSIIAEACGYRTSRRDAAVIADSLDRPVSNLKADDETTLGALIPYRNQNGETDIEAVEGELYRQQLRHALTLALASLSEAQRIAITNRYLDNLTLTEIAQQTGVKYEILRQSVNNGLQALRRNRDLQQFVDMKTDYYRGGFRPAESLTIEREHLKQRWRRDHRGSSNAD